MTNSNEVHRAYNQAINENGKPTLLIQAYINDGTLIPTDLIEVVFKLINDQDVLEPDSMIAMFFTGVLYGAEHPIKV